MPNYATFGKRRAPYTGDRFVLAHNARVAAEKRKAEQDAVAFVASVKARRK